MACLIAAAFLLFASSVAMSQSKFEATYSSTYKALVQGKIKEALASLESQAQEAERNATTSWFPQRYWEAATDAYREAARAARFSGQLQKSITHGEKALETAKKTKDATFQIRVIAVLIETHHLVRNFDRARDLIDKGLELVRDLPPHVFARTASTCTFQYQLGVNLIWRREYEKAIDALSQSQYLSQAILTEVSTWRYVDPTHWASVEDARENFQNLAMLIVVNLGNAYRQAGKFQEALGQYQHAFKSIKEWGLKTPFESVLHEGMGEIYLNQGDFPLALENFKKAIALAERQQMSAAIISASTRIGDVLRQTGMPTEALHHYQKAIQQIESTRSLLESVEYRQSFFEGGIDAHIRMMDALLLAGKQEEAFNYSERARSRVFLDVLGSKVQLSRAKGTLVEEERVLQERIAGLKAKVAVVREEEARVALTSSH